MFYSYKNSFGFVLAEKEKERKEERRTDDDEAVKGRAAKRPGKVPMVVGTGDRMTSPLLALLPFLVGVLVFSRTFHYSFVFDDTASIVENEIVTSEALNWSALFSSDFWGTSMNSNYSHKSYRPLTTLTFRWDRFLSGNETWSFHVTNSILHGTVASLSFFLAALLFDQRCSTALLTSLAFACHPVHTEAIANITGRSEPLYSLFVASTLLVLLRADKRKVRPLSARKDDDKAGHVRRNSLFFCFSTVMTVMALCIGALLSKETGVVLLPLIVVAFVASSGGKRPSSDGEKPLPLLRSLSVSPSSPACSLWLFSTVAVIGVLAGYFWLRVKLSGESFSPNVTVMDNPLVALSGLEWLQMWIVLNSFYVSLSLFPFPLSPDYSFNCFPLPQRGELHPLLLPSLRRLALPCLLLLFLIVVSRRRKAVIIAMFWYVTTFFPASNTLFHVGTAVGERLLYLPSLAVCVLFAEGVDLITTLICRKRRDDGISTTKGLAEGESKKTVASRAKDNVSKRKERGLVHLSTWFFAAVILGGMAGLTVESSVIWENKTTVFEAAASVCPQSTKTQKALGSDLVARADAIRERLEREAARNSKGNSLEQRLLQEEEALLRKALGHYRKAREIMPQFYEAVYELGVLELRIGEREAGEKTLRDLLTWRSSSFKAANALAFALLEDGKLEDAAEAFLSCLVLAPTTSFRAEMASNIGNVFSQFPPTTPLNAILSQTITNAAVKDDGTKRVPPRSLDSRLRALDASIAFHRLSLRLRPNGPDGWFNLGVLFLRTGELKKALKVFSVAQRLNPTEAEYARAVHHVISRLKSGR